MSKLVLLLSLFAALADILDGIVIQTIDIAALPQGDLHIWLTSIASYLGKTDAVDDSRLPGRVEYDYVRFYTRP